MNGYATGMLAKKDEEIAALRSKLVAVETMAERAWRHGYDLDPAEVLETIAGEYPSEGES